jgi:hypothetical protein
MNELVVFWIIVSSDLGDIGGLGLIINFSSAMLICQLDDILFDSSRVHNLLEKFNGIADTKNDFQTCSLKKNDNQAIDQYDGLQKF